MTIQPRSHGCEQIIGGKTLPPGGDGGNSPGNCDHVVPSACQCQLEAAAGPAATDAKCPALEVTAAKLGAARGDRAVMEVKTRLSAFAECESSRGSIGLPDSGAAGRERMGGRTVNDGRTRFGFATRGSGGDDSVQDVG